MTLRDTDGPRRNSQPVFEKEVNDHGFLWFRLRPFDMIA